MSEFYKMCRVKSTQDAIDSGVFEETVYGLVATKYHGRDLITILVDGKNRPASYHKSFWCVVPEGEMAPTPVYIP